MTEPLQALFQQVGTELTFASNSIFGLVGFLNDTLYSPEYEVNAQNFNFVVTTLDCNETNIQVDDTFIFEDTTYLFTFKVKTQPIHDLTGVSEFFASYVTKVAI